MAQVTLYLDDATAAIMRERAAAAGQSHSRWVVDLIRHCSANQWPNEVLALAGAYPDFPLFDQTQNHAPDAARIGF